MQKKFCETSDQMPSLHQARFVVPEGDIFDALLTGAMFSNDFLLQ
jgi:hypothetical protein